MESGAREPDFEYQKFPTSRGTLRLNTLSLLYIPHGAVLETKLFNKCEILSPLPSTQ